MSDPQSAGCQKLQLILNFLNLANQLSPKLKNSKLSPRFQCKRSTRKRVFGFKVFCFVICVVTKMDDNNEKIPLVNRKVLITTDAISSFKLPIADYQPVANHFSGKLSVLILVSESRQSEKCQLFRFTFFFKFIFLRKYKFHSFNDKIKQTIYTAGSGLG